MTKTNLPAGHVSNPVTRTGRPSPRTNKGTGKAPIKDKDQKILWSRAAGLCSICREKLTFDDEAEASAGTLGAMCHIVGEKVSAARGKSKLPFDQRNTYTNLILLCSHHHDEIDKHESKYPIETLHKIKDGHELFVSESLSNTVNPDDMVYSDLIDTISTSLQLEHWWWFVDNAVRDFVPIEVTDAQGVLNCKRLNAIWPKKKVGLKTSILELIDSFDKYMSHYMTNVEEKISGKMLGPDRSYRRFWNPHFDEHWQKEDKWSKVNFWLLCDYIIKLNAFADSVRKHVNPLFFRTAGKFIVHDSMGYRFEGRDTLYDPSPNDVTKGLAALKYEVK